MTHLARPITLGLALILSALAGVAAGDDAAEQRTADYFESIRAEPLMQLVFLRQMPKGGDLHNHLSGAVYAETLIGWAAEAGLCADRRSAALSAGPCDAAQDRPPVTFALTPGGDALRALLIDQWSMRNFVPGPRSGHDHFFETFAKFGPATRGRTGEMLAEVMARAAAQRELYLELMLTADGSAAADLGTALGWDADLGRFRERLLAGGLGQAIAVARRTLDQTEATARARLRCETPAADPGCDVEVRYLYQVLRNSPPERVFAQIVLGFELTRAERRVVGLNLVQPEDGYLAMRDYELHMTMLDHLHRLDPTVNVSLHAGELAPGLVPPEGLCCHVRLAVERGHARRIGHGVAVMYERDPEGLLREMARRRVLVEIALTSNAGILGVQGPMHPLAMYLRSGVPVALATDDEGVNRSDLTQEYFRAAREHGLGYGDLKQSARNSLEHSFLPGDSLWETSDVFVPVAACASDRPGAASVSIGCRAFLAGSERARLQWRLEAAFADFEPRY
ncbi:MAG TPA: adenosine deaminase [Methylomirabilota bacterium]|nr:adenosine deaminase [Methylomirabilota bacterium]